MEEPHVYADYQNLLGFSDNAATTQQIRDPVEQRDINGDTTAGFANIDTIDRQSDARENNTRSEEHTENRIESFIERITPDSLNGLIDIMHEMKKLSCSDAFKDRSKTGLLVAYKWLYWFILVQILYIAWLLLLCR